MYHPLHRGRSLGAWQALGIIVVVLYVVIQFVVFQLSLARLPGTWTIGGRAYPDQSIDEASAQVNIDLQQPVTLYYMTNTIALDPSAIDFTFDVTVTTRLIRDARSQSSALTDFMRRLIFQPPAPRDIPIVVSYSEEKARALLAEAASRYDQPAQPPTPLTTTMILQPGQPGYQLNVVKSMGAIDAALKSPAQREVELIVERQPAPSPSLDQLTVLIQARLAQFPGSASIFVKDLQTGQEIDLNPDIAYSGLGVMKLPIMIEVFRKFDTPLSLTTTQLLSQALSTELSNLPANQLLNLIGDGNTFAGADTLTASMRNLGLRDTFMAQPYDQPITATATISTPANSNPAANTHANPSIQTTPADIGLLLEMIDQCTRQGGALLVVYRDQFTPKECQQMIELLKQASPADVPPLLRGGVPDQSAVAHRPGWNADTRSDAALFFTAGGNYIVVVFLNTPNQAIDWNTANSLMADISRAAYNYFNPK